jgi:hypothetical protein
MKRWDVYLNRKHIDQVSYCDSYRNAEEVKRSLVDHDGYDPDIKVRRVPAPKRYYIQRQGEGYLETVDEFETRKEAKLMLAEYQANDSGGIHYISQRACKGWQK